MGLDLQLVFFFFCHLISPCLVTLQHVSTPYSPLPPSSISFFTCISPICLSRCAIPPTPLIHYRQQTNVSVLCVICLSFFFFCFFSSGISGWFFFVVYMPPCFQCIPMRFFFFFIKRKKKKKKCHRSPVDQLVDSPYSPLFSCFCFMYLKITKFLKLNISVRCEADFSFLTKT